ncbi:MAG: glycosyltransferase [Deltaproteobacteria bacterium]|nr:glycosyltransferase [Deltaproteobacteria bacterium]
MATEAGTGQGAGGGVDTPELSIVIPVYNEETILEQAVTTLVERVRVLGRSFELVLAANGCRDRTVPLGHSLAARFPEVRVLECPTPNYGAALKLGMLQARGDIVLCDEIDLCDVDFYRRALDLLDEGRADLVVGSKAMAGSNDRRPALRRAGTRVINGMLRASLGFRGTDTHGLKAFRRAPLLPVIHACVVDKDLFASELVIRAQRAGVACLEIPVSLEEQRKPSIHLVRRVPNVLRNMARLVWVIRLGAP